MRLLLPLIVLLLTPGVAAQHVHTTTCTLYDRGDVAAPGPILDVAPHALTADAQGVTTVVTRGTATFQVDYSASFTTEARAAFQRAVDIWSTHIVSSVPIRISADYAPLASGILGSAGPNITANFTNRPIASTWYPFALADALAGRDLSPDSGDFFYDIVATFSSARSDWYFGLDGNPPSNQFDFTTVVLHEIGHGLGFLGSGQRDNGSGDQECAGVGGQGCWGFASSIGTLPIVFDRFVDDGQGRSFLSTLVYPNPSNTLGLLLQSRDLFMDSPEVVRLYGEPAPIWAIAPFDAGSSFSHWDEEVFQDDFAALMTPEIARGEAYQDPGTLTCAFFSDIGWQLGDGCADLTVDDELAPDASGLSVSLAGPNPFRTATTVRVRRERAGPLRATLVDVLGREVARLHDGPALAEVTLRVAPRASASGVYRVVVESEGTTRMLSLTRVR